MRSAAGEAASPAALRSASGLGASAGAWDAYIEVGGEAANAQVGKRTRSGLLLRSNQMIIRFFNANPHLNLLSGEA